MYIRKSGKSTYRFGKMSGFDGCIPLASEEIIRTSDTGHFTGQLFGEALIAVCAWTKLTPLVRGKKKTFKL